MRHLGLDGWQRDSMDWTKGYDWVEHYINQLKSEDPKLRYEAAFELGDYEDKRATKPLIAALQDSNDNVRHNAAYALGQIYAKEQIKPLYVVRALLKALRKDENVNARKGIVYALCYIPHKIAVPALIRVLLNEKEDAEVRISAVHALGEIRDTRAIAPLIKSLAKLDVIKLDLALAKMGSAVLPEMEKLLRDKNIRMRLKALSVLEDIHDLRAIELIAEALNDNDPSVRRYAAGSLKNIGMADAWNFSWVTDINELIRLRAKLVALVEKHKDSDFYDKLKYAASKLLIKINARKNQLLDIDIQLPKPKFKPTSGQGSRYRMERRLVA